MKADVDPFPLVPAMWIAFRAPRSTPSAAQCRSTCTEVSGLGFGDSGWGLGGGLRVATPALARVEREQEGGGASQESRSWVGVRAGRSGGRWYLWEHGHALSRSPEHDQTTQALNSFVKTACILAASSHTRDPRHGSRLAPPSPEHLLFPIRSSDRVREGSAGR